MSKAPLTKVGYEFPINEIDTKTIINEIAIDDFDSDVLNDVIFGLEANVANVVRQCKTASIPYIGCLRINPISKIINDNKLNFRIARQHMTKEEYKHHVSSFIVDGKIKQHDKDKQEQYIALIRRNNKVKYTQLFTALGKATAELYIYSLSLFKEVPFDEDWELHYQSLKDDDETNTDCL